ncbi:hypothetical protein N7493_010522 [Penicillium malachiteum]|uniref:Uncharacterized protein n=1 Tax=Penicillium malachiteum TaxID=1324776 RepID=A0AAD6HCY6_9EURO|nr:hypothetical protein N7493_010522 [Penicillium malachiteum]
MQYTTLATLLFATAALAAPKPQDSDSYATSSDDYEGYDDGYDSVPTALESVLATAIPTTWLMEYETNDAFFTSVVDAMEKGDYPQWVDDLPSSAHAYVTSELQEQLSEYTSEMAAATGYDFTNTDSQATATATDSATVLTGTVASTGSTTDSTSTATGSSKSGTSGASSSGSSAAASSTSSAGAPAATGTIAMGLAGAAGILGIALAL